MYRIKYDDEWILMKNTYFFQSDRLILSWKHAVSGEKRTDILEKPNYPIYLLKDEFETLNYFEEYRPVEDLNKIWVGYKYREYNIAKMLGGGLYEDIQNRRVSRNAVHLNTRLFGADMNIEELVMMEWKKSRKGKDVKIPLHIGIFDIETDIRKTDVKMNQPIISIAYCDMLHNEIYVTGIIRKDFKNSKLPIDKPEEFERISKERIIKQLEAKLIGSHLDNPDSDVAKVHRTLFYKTEKRVKSMKIITKMFKKEVDVIQDVMHKIFNHYVPDILYIYNMEFDIGHIQIRAEKLKMNFDALISTENLGQPESIVRFQSGDNKQDPKLFKHVVESVTPVKILDYAVVYAALRPFNTYSTWRLDAVLDREINIGKYDYSHIAPSIREFAYNDFTEFLIYNILDTLSIGILDDHVQDSLRIFNKRYITNCEYTRVTISMQATSMPFIYQNYISGLIVGQNVNKYLIQMFNTKGKLLSLKENNPAIYNLVENIIHSGKKDTKSTDPDDGKYHVVGGQVSNPQLFVAKGLDLIKINGHIRTAIFKSVSDSDAKAMYPSNYMSGNLSKSTLLGRLYKIDGTIIDNEKDVIPLINRDPITIGSTFFGLPTIEEIMEFLFNSDINHNVKDAEKVSSIHHRRDDFIGKANMNLFKKLRNLIKQKTMSLDLNTGTYKLTNHMFLSTENKYLSYNGTAVNISIEGLNSCKDIFPLVSNETILVNDLGLTEVEGYQNKQYMVADVTENIYKQYLDILNQVPDVSNVKPLQSGVIDIRKLYVDGGTGAVTLNEFGLRIVPNSIPYDITRFKKEPGPHNINIDIYEAEDATLRNVVLTSYDSVDNYKIKVVQHMKVLLYNITKEMM